MIRLFESGDLIAINTLLSSNEWPFHSHIFENAVNKEPEYFFSGTNRTLVFISLGDVLGGYIRFFDIEDSDTDSPLFDIRINGSLRGQGIGTQLVRTGVKYIFENFTNIRRIEATTREDNVAMSNILKEIGFVLEAKYRKAWKVNDGEYMDAFGYGLLEEDLARD